VLSVKGLYKAHKDQSRKVRAVQDVSFEVPRGQFFTLLGPSGCGKTTTLRSIAGLERPDAGEIVLADRIVYASDQGIFVPPNHRDIGMVFQSYAIWPHMTVFQNAAFPLQVMKQRPSRAQVEERVMRVLGTVALDGLESREATRLSGGQQQRLALARALVMEPALLLLDEPLSNLDAKLRERMRFELKRLQRELGITTVYVTHDQTEALALSNRIAVMREGRIVQVGAPREIYEFPNSEFVADFIGTTNLVAGELAGAVPEDGRVAVRTAIGELTGCPSGSLQPGHEAVVSVRPEHVEIHPTRPDGRNVWQATVLTRAFLGDYTDVQLAVDATTVVSRIHYRLEARNGSTVWIRMNPEKCIVIARNEAKAA
jgi:iron(III) transport system ATP-binding protein